MNNLIRSATRTDGDKLKCLIVCRENEKFIKLLSNANCELYVIEHPGLSSWKENIEDLPENVFLIGKGIQEFKASYIDCIIVNDRLQEFDIGAQLSRQMHIPLILVDHATESQIQKNPFGVLMNNDPALKERRGNINVTTGSSIQSGRQSDPVSVCMNVEIVADTSKYSPAEKTNNIAIDNNAPPELFNAFQNLTERNAVGIFGNEDGSPEEILNKSKIFISTWSGMDIKILEAMSSGCTVIAPDTPDIRGVIEHGKTGFLYNTIQEMQAILNDNLENYDEEIGKAARQLVVDKYSDKEPFTKRWNQILSYISKTIFKLGA